MAELVINGAPRKLKLTLGALARLEQAFGAEGLAALGQKLEDPRAGDLLAVVAALIVGDDMDVAALARADLDLLAAARAVAAAFAEGSPPAKKTAGGPFSADGSPTACASWG